LHLFQAALLVSGWAHEARRLATNPEQ
jgi:hypothetical protein